MSSPTPNLSPTAACDRLAAILERSRTLEAGGVALRAGDDAEVIRVPMIRYAEAITRMRIRPALEPGWAKIDPVHVAMFGGTNSGKSTVLNILLGRPAAGMSFRARFSQHPEAYRPAALGDEFLDRYASRFPGYQRHHDRHPPRQDDEDLRDNGYRPALALNDPESLDPPESSDGGGLGVATGPWPRLGLPPRPSGGRSSGISPTSRPRNRAPISRRSWRRSRWPTWVVMAVTNENYADHRGALLRSMVIESGVPIRVVANKLDGGSALLDDVPLQTRRRGSPRPSPTDRIRECPPTGSTPCPTPAASTTAIVSKP